MHINDGFIRTPDTPFQMLVSESGTVMAYHDPVNMLGYSITGDSVIGQNWIEYFVSLSQQKLIANTARIVAYSESSKGLVCDLKDSSGHYLYFDLLLVPFSHQGNQYLQIFGFEHLSNLMKEFHPNKVKQSLNVLSSF